MPHDVVISHSTAGKLTADAICSELESIGIRCWILPRDLSIGIGWDQSVANAVASCRVMVVVLSDYANRSDRVDRQLEHAFNNGLIIIPFRAEFNPVPAEPQLDSVHWLDAVTPEIAQRLRSLRDLVRGLTPYPQDVPSPVMALTAGEKEIPQLRVEEIADPPDREKTTDKMSLPAGGPVQEVASEETKRPPVLEVVAEDKLKDHGRAARPPKKASKWAPLKALLLVLLPFAIICGLGVWQVKKGPLWATRPRETATASLTPPATVKVQRQEKFAASDPGWGTLDANWLVADGRLQVKPLLNSSAVLINHTRGFTDAEISADIVMSKGEDLDQLGGLIFWAKDYNDCYALVVSADGKFAVGRKLIGRWINPIAKTGNTAIKTGIGQINKLRVRTEGSLLTASINDIQVASVSGDPPQGVSYIGLYGESAETTQNVWEFTNVVVTSAR
jgi:hypothetical protein